MNWARKFYEMNLSEIENAVVEDVPFFVNGLEIKEKDSNYRILVYQEPFSDVVVSVTYFDDKEEDSERYLYDVDRNVWTVLPAKNGNDDRLLIL